MQSDSGKASLAWRAVNALVMLFCIATMMMLLAYFGKNGVASSQPSQGLEYKDFIAILLTALGVMIAVAALAIAMLAIWGFEAGRKLLLESAQAAAVTHVEKIVPQLV